MKFWPCCVTKSSTTEVNYSYSDDIYALDYDGTKQKPHDHLFKVGEAQKEYRSEKVKFLPCCVTKRSTTEVNCSYSDEIYAWDYDGTKQKPHDHLFKKLAKPALTLFAPKRSIDRRK